MWMGFQPTAQALLLRTSCLCYDCGTLPPHCFFFRVPSLNEFHSLPI